MTTPTVRRAVAVLLLITSTVLVMTISTDSPLDARSPEEPTSEPKTTPPQVPTWFYDQLTTARHRVADLEKQLEMLTEETRRGFPGLHFALRDMKGLVIEVEDLPLDAVRYGLTKKNIIDAVKARLQRHGIRALTHDEALASGNREDLQIAFSPDLCVEITMLPFKSAIYDAVVTVALEKDVYGVGPSHKDMGMPEVAEAARNSERASADLYSLSDSLPDYSNRTDEMQKKWDKAHTHWKQAEAKYKAACDRAMEEFVAGRPPDSPWQRPTSCTEWKCTLWMRGALKSFAEDERNALDDLVDVFAREFRKANPVQPPS